MNEDIFFLTTQESQMLNLLGKTLSPIINMFKGLKEAMRRAPHQAENSNKSINNQTKILLLKV